MNVLPYRVRRFIRHNLTWHNVRFQWTIIGFCLVTLAICGFTGFEHPILRSILAGVPGYIGAQFLYAAARFPLPQDEPVFVQIYGDIQRWIEHKVEPGYYGVLRSGAAGVKIIRPIFIGEFNEVYDLDGRLLGHEQDVWNDDHWTFTPVEEGDQRRLPLIAYWRTKAMKPLGMA